MGNRKELLNKEKSNKEMVVVVGMTVFFIAMLCVFGLAVWYATKWNNKVPNSIAALHKKVLQLKIGSNTK
jgi:hypothetical protein